MQLALSALSAHLQSAAQKGLRPIYVLYGDEALLQLEAADAIRATAKQLGFTERTVFTVQGAHFDWSEVLSTGQSMGLFGDKQMLDIRIPTGKPGKEGSLALQQMAQSAADNDSTLTLISLPRLDKATQTSAWFSALEGAGATLKIDTIERNALPQWIAQRLGQQGQRVADGAQGQQALQFFADCVEGNLMAAFQEIQKLALLYPQGELSLAQIESAVLNVARYDVFKLSDAILTANAARTQRMLDGLCAEGVAAVLVHWAIAEDIRALHRVASSVATGKPLPMVLREQRIWGPKEKHFERMVPRLKQAHLNHLLQSAHQVDGVVKGLRHPDWPSDPWQALHRLAQMVVKLAR